MSRGQDLLLSAAAGSGKTTVLVERVLALIREGADVEHLLIVTFTRAAAADMRRKLTEELMARAEEDPGFAPQLEKVERATVATIHSFCSDLLKDHFESAGVDPAFRILDDAELKQYEAQALNEAMEQAYAAADLMVGRSGAGTVMETAMVGLPTVFVPLPHGNGEQARNARFLVEADAALLVADSDLSPDLLAATVIGLIRQPGRLATMSSTCRELVPSGAAEALAELVLQAGKGE